jgi:hypothetical protein
LTSPTSSEPQGTSCRTETQVEQAKDAIYPGKEVFLQDKNNEWTHRGEFRGEA